MAMLVITRGYIFLGGIAMFHYFVEGSSLLISDHFLQLKKRWSWRRPFVINSPVAASMGTHPGKLTRLWSYKSIEIMLNPYYCCLNQLKISQKRVCLKIENDAQQMAIEI